MRQKELYLYNINLEEVKELDIDAKTILQGEIFILFRNNVPVEDIRNSITKFIEDVELRNTLVNYLNELVEWRENDDGREFKRIC